MSNFRIRQQIFGDDHSQLQNALATVHHHPDRPACLCREPAVPMYVAKAGGHYILKRMPGTGSQHDPACDSYEPPAELSGLGEVLGSAIQENVEEGTTALRLAFGLTKRPGHSPVSDTGEAESVQTDGTKLTLRGTLHYLWEQAEFSKWVPGMAGKRNWSVLRKHLLHAAEDKQTKGLPLCEALYIPEPFSLERQKEIAEQRRTQLAPLAISLKGTRRLMLVIAEVKEIAPARYGHKLIAKHLPDFPFFLNDELHKRLVKRFAQELELWNAAEETHLMLIGTFSLGLTGVASLEELSLSLMSEHWIPFEHLSEKTLLDQLVSQRRSFIKGLRYNLPAHRPLASAVLSDTKPQAIALYVAPSGASDEGKQALAELAAAGELSPWLWDAGVEEMPPLPPRQGYQPPKWREEAVSVKVS